MLSFKGTHFPKDVILYAVFLVLSHENRLQLIFTQIFIFCDRSSTI
ncbi:hypothetical protein [Bathymodiolus platifrons methanotrophic gill symbiont]|nr:hypothetical protein [Bathymodiolus platifrons methanotrophic gill symbiont]